MRKRRQRMFQWIELPNFVLPSRETRIRPWHFGNTNARGNVAQEKYIIERKINYLSWNRCDINPLAKIFVRKQRKKKQSCCILLSHAINRPTFFSKAHDFIVTILWHWSWVQPIFSILSFYKMQILNLTNKENENSERFWNRDCDIFEHIFIKSSVCERSD